MIRREFSFPSATGVCTVSACAYLPETEPETVLVIHHGMAEHRERYEPFIGFLCDHGTAVYMHDMANHGKSNEKTDETGWFGETDGWKGLIEDFRTMVRRAAEEHPGKKLIVMGHSMGSFLCRLYTAQYPEDSFAGAILAKAIAAFKGKKHKSALLNRIAFGTYNKRFEGRTDFDWLTRDREIVDRYIADPYCGYLFTVQGMEDLIRANAASNAKDWYEKVPKNLPVLLVSGEEDPVGDYGSGVKNVADRLKTTGHTRVTVKLYPGCRHEVLNETNRQEVMDDLLAWMGTVPETR